MNTDRKFYPSTARLAGATGLLLLIPLIAMQFTNEVAWSLSDFTLMGTLIFGTGFTYQFITRKSVEIAYRIATGYLSPPIIRKPRRGEITNTVQRPVNKASGRL